MTFYHFTSSLHWPIIQMSGFLKTVESNVGSVAPNESPYGTHVGPDVVWLVDQPGFTDPTPTYHGLSLMKRQVRFEVDVPAIRWLDWAPARQMDPNWRETFIRMGGGMTAAEHWYVFPARILSRRWVDVIDTATGESLLTPSGTAT